MKCLVCKKGVIMWSSYGHGYICILCGNRPEFIADGSEFVNG